MGNLSNYHKTSIKIAVFSALIIFSSAINNSAQSIEIQETWDDTESYYSVCGRIENEQLTIPSYKFRVVDKNGTILKNLRTEGELVIEEGIWTGNIFSDIFGMDAFWKTVNHNIKIPVTYNSKEDVYVTQEVPKVNVAKRKKGGNQKCFDKITKLRFSFYQNDCDSTGFRYFFTNRTVNTLNLPSAEKVYNLGIIEGDSCIK